jgi:hypothetical protein
MALEVTMVKGLTEDAIIRLATIKVQIDQRFGQVDARLDRMEMMLTEILARLPKP